MKHSIHGSLLWPNRWEHILNRRGVNETVASTETGRQRLMMFFQRIPLGRRGAELLLFDLGC